MMHISFAWTVDALLRGLKTATRRCWKDKYAALFGKGDLVGAIDKDFRVGGKRVGTIRLTADPFRQLLSEMTEVDLVAEGGLWDSLDDFRAGFPCPEPYLVRFELVALRFAAWRNRELHQFEAACGNVEELRAAGKGTGDFFRALTEAVRQVLGPIPLTITVADDAQWVEVALQ